jgi:hypothetical protein
MKGYKMKEDFEKTLQHLKDSTGHDLESIEVIACVGKKLIEACNGHTIATNVTAITHLLSMVLANCETPLIAICLLGGIKKTVEINLNLNNSQETSKYN